MKTHYIVACWLGPRRSQPLSDPLMYIKYHVNFLKKASQIDKATFVVNKHKEEKIDHLTKMIGATVIYRENLGCSYSAWEEAIIQNLNSTDYHFLIEDDYLPSRKNFISKYTNKITENSTIIQTRHVWEECLVSNYHAKKIYEKTGRVFNTTNSTDYEGCERNQTHWADLFRELYGFDKLIEIPQDEIDGKHFKGRFFSVPSNEMAEATGCYHSPRQATWSPTWNEVIWTSKFKIMNKQLKFPDNDIIPICLLQTLNKLI